MNIIFRHTKIMIILLGILTKIWRTWGQELNSLLWSSGAFWLHIKLLINTFLPHVHGYKTNEQIHVFLKVFSIHSLQKCTITCSKIGFSFDWNNSKTVPFCVKRWQINSSNTVPVNEMFFIIQKCEYVKEILFFTDLGAM